ncbi:hypothetical protein AB0451_33775 [Streptomyces sp. NPDC052000]|uniref:hypothetical protein n=1 Tax=Streptomyces sp. NPDC052000 TaxID=3155676 RepID=UPI00344DF04E
MANMKYSFIMSMQELGVMRIGTPVVSGDPIILESRRRNAVLRWMQRAYGMAQADAAQSAASALGLFQTGWGDTFGFPESTSSESAANAFLTRVYPAWQQAWAAVQNQQAHAGV